MERSGILVKNGKLWAPGKQRLHTERDATTTKSMHTQFRLRAIEEFAQSPSAESAHYSLMVGLSQRDAQKIRELILGLIADSEALIGPSQEEVAYQLNLDWFRVDG